jgi:uncharacterized protein (TIGR03086 family)
MPRGPFPDGVWFVDLSTIVEPELVVTCATMPCGGSPRGSPRRLTRCLTVLAASHQPFAGGLAAYTRSAMREIHERVALRFAQYVAEVPPDGWRGPTPCNDWDVRALVDHVVRWNTFMPDFLRGQTLAEMDRPFERDVLGDTPAASAEASARAAVAAFAPPDALTRTIHHAIGDISGEHALFLRVIDNTIHGWDLATAIGAQTALDAEAVNILYAYARDNRAIIRASGAFGPAEIDVPESADTQTRLLGILGRRA